VHQWLFVRGSDRARIRPVSYEVETPEFPRGASFFNQQELPLRQQAHPPCHGAAQTG